MHNREKNLFKQKSKIHICFFSVKQTARDKARVLTEAG